MEPFCSAGDVDGVREGAGRRGAIVGRGRKGGERATTFGASMRESSRLKRNSSDSSAANLSEGIAREKCERSLERFRRRFSSSASKSASVRRESLVDLLEVERRVAEERREEEADDFMLLDRR